VYKIYKYIFGAKQCFDIDIGGTADPVLPNPKSVMGEGAKMGKPSAPRIGEGWVEHKLYLLWQGCQMSEIYHRISRIYTDPYYDEVKPVCIRQKKS